MESTRPRMIAVAVMVCLFAVGMAMLLNYFKYRSTAERIVKTRLVVVGKSIENSIQASLNLGIAFADLGTLPALMERERATDDLILGIKVFDTAGKPLYSTDRLRIGRRVPASWMTAAHKAGDADWFVEEGEDTAVGISIKNNFGLTVGYLALRYSRDKIDRMAHGVARELAVAGLAIFGVAATLATLALTLVMRRFETEMRAVESALERSGAAGPVENINRGPFGPALVQFFDMVRAAEAQITAVRARLGREAQR